MVGLSLTPKAYTSVLDGKEGISQEDRESGYTNGNASMTFSTLSVGTPALLMIARVSCFFFSVGSDPQMIKCMTSSYTWL
jgi:hypothetical protein